MPGGGLRERWGIRETEHTSSQHLRLDSIEGAADINMSDDARKALASAGSSGGKYYPIRLTDGSILWGADRYAELSVDNGEVLGTFGDNTPLVVTKQIGKGFVIYCGSNVTVGTHNGVDGFRSLIRLACDHAGVAPALGALTADDANVRVDLISDCDDNPRYVVILNREQQEEEIAFSSPLKLRGLFSGMELDLQESSVHVIPPEFADLFQVL